MNSLKLIPPLLDDIKYACMQKISQKFLKEF